MSGHVPVLLQEVLEGLDIRKGEKVVDATLGGGGYAKAFCRAVGETGTVIGIDQDASAVRDARERFGKVECSTHFVEGNFRDLTTILSGLGITEVHKVAFDLGFSSVQIERSGRGFSFQKDEPLLMTLRENPEADDITARQIINNWSEEALNDVFYGYGEERSSRKIARVIVEARREKPIETTGELTAVITSVIKRRGKIHPATKVFQALRIAVNDELGALEEGLQQAFKHLSSDGRIAVVSFHSLEDRIVKHFFKELEQQEKGNALTKKPITPTEKEKEENVRSRSAKLRVFSKK